MKTILMVTRVFCGIAIAAFALMSCASGPAATDRGPVCRTAVQYTGHEFSLSGLQLQSLKFQLGSAVWKTDALQQAQAVTQALDVMQFGDCQLAEVLGKDDPKRSELLEHQNTVVNAMLTSVKAFSAATTPEQASKAVTDAQSTASTLAAKSPSATDSKNPPAASAVSSAAKGETPTDPKGSSGTPVPPKP